MPWSEVARIRKAIEEEHAAGQRALYDFAMVGRHAFIEAREQRIGEHFQSIATLLGSEQQAMSIVVEALEHAGEEEVSLEKGE